VLLDRFSVGMGYSAALSYIRKIVREVSMEWFLIVPLVLVVLEFNRVARHINSMKDDINSLKDEVKALKQDVRYLESRID